MSSQRLLGWRRERGRDSHTGESSRASSWDGQTRGHQKYKRGKLCTATDTCFASWSPKASARPSSHKMLERHPGSEDRPPAQSHATNQRQVDPVSPGLLAPWPCHSSARPNPDSSLTDQGWRVGGGKWSIPQWS